MEIQAAENTVIIRVVVVFLIVTFAVTSTIMKRKEPFSTEQLIQHHAALVIAILLSLLGCTQLLGSDHRDPVMGIGLIAVAAIFIPIWIVQKDTRS